MNQEESRERGRFLLEVAEWLEVAGIGYAIVGGLAVVRYGYVRKTKNIDLLLQSADAATFGKTLASKGYELEETDGRDFWMYVQKEQRRRIDLIAANDPFKGRILADRTSVSIGKREINFVRLEDLVALKCRAIVSEPRRAPQDAADIQMLYQVSGDDDKAAIRQVAKVFGLEELL